MIAVTKILPNAAEAGSFLGVVSSSFTPGNTVNLGTNGTLSVLGQFSSLGCSESVLIDFRLQRTVTCSNWAISTAVATSKILLLITSSFPVNDKH